MELHELRHVHELRNAVEHDVAVEADGTVVGVRIRIAQGEGITVWAGELVPGAEDKPGSQIEASDFSKRTVVHFVSWDSVQNYYEDSRYATLVDSIRAKTLRFSTVPRSDSDASE